MRKFAFGILALALAFTSIGSACAAPILVLTDSGNLGEFTFTNTGIVSGTAFINVAAPSLLSSINTVNGAIVPAELIHVNTPLVMQVTPIGGGQYNVALPPNITKTVGATVGQQAILGFNVLQGDTPTALPNFFNASGPVVSLLANANPNYDFSAFANGLGRINFTFTATTFTGVTSFASLFSTVGSTAVGNGSFSQIAVPEPPSMVILGAGLMGLYTVRRFVRA